MTMRSAVRTFARRIERVERKTDAAHGWRQACAAADALTASMVAQDWRAAVRALVGLGVGAAEADRVAAHLQSLRRAARGPL
jgi:hypothetical protein